MKKIIKIIPVACFLFVVGLASLYIFQIIKLTEETYLVQSHQAQIQRTINEIRSLSEPLSKKLTLEEMEEMARARKFTDLRVVNYVEARESEVVAR